MDLDGAVVYYRRCRVVWRSADETIPPSPPPLPSPERIPPTLRLQPRAVPAARRQHHERFVRRPAPSYEQVTAPVAVFGADLSRLLITILAWSTNKYSLQYVKSICTFLVHFVIIWKGYVSSGTRILDLRFYVLYTVHGSVFHKFNK